MAQEKPTRPIAEDEKRLLRSYDFCICAYAVCEGPIRLLVVQCEKHVQLHEKGAPRIAAVRSGDFERGA